MRLHYRSARHVFPASTGKSLNAGQRRRRAPESRLVALITASISTLPPALLDSIIRPNSIENVITQYSF